MALRPFQFQPLFQQRIWGGRELATRYHKALPSDGAPYGESWEVVDRSEAQSVVADGPLHGKTLHELWSKHRIEIFGPTAPTVERFPLLIKILDAREVLSLQVHPPAHLAGDLGGEPKTEMWYVARAEPGARLYAGVRPGVTREIFSQALASGKVEPLTTDISVSAGDFIFIPSGRLHAIGAGLVIFEIQQNSDTTYRVFDWNRVGLDGLPRSLHVVESLQCIDFTDDTPVVEKADCQTLVDCPCFRVDHTLLPAGNSLCWGQTGEFFILAVVTGMVTLSGQIYRAGDHVLVPAAASTDDRTLQAESNSTLMKIMFGQSEH